MGTPMLATTLLSLGTLSHPVGRPLLRLWGRGMLAILGVHLIVRGREHVSGRVGRIVLDFILLDRTDRGRAAASLRRAADRIIRERLSVIIAPEGTRSRDGTLDPFKLGPMHLAVASHAPIVPMVIAGSARAMPHGQGWSRGGTIVVEFLPPIATDDDTLDNLRERTDMLRDRFVAALARLDP